jgi:hypothetical protein
MRFVFLTILYIVATAITPRNPKLCVDCKFFRKSLFRSNTYGVCTLFPKEDVSAEEAIHFLVDGIDKKKNTEYYYCSTARSFDDMCGRNGTMFEQNNKKRRLTPLDLLRLPNCIQEELHNLIDI